MRQSSRQKSRCNNFREPLVRETRTTVSETSQPHCPTSGNSLGASSNDAKSHRSRTDPFSNDVTRLATKNDCPWIETNATVIEIATTKSPSSPSGATTVVPSGATLQNVTPSIDLPAKTYYSGNAKKAALKMLGNCLKYPTKDVARQSSRKVFEIARNKTKYSGRAARRTEIDDRERDRESAVKVPPPTNEFWRHVTFPTRAPLTVVGPAYRARGLGGPRRSRKRTKLNNDIYEGFRRFYGVGKNEEGTEWGSRSHEIIGGLISPPLCVWSRMLEIMRHKV